VEAVKKRIGEALTQNPGYALVVSGGVAANSHIRSALTTLAEKENREIHIPPVSLCGDNAAMIAAAGYYEYLENRLADSSLNASALDSIL
jgi:N6-L-threonylcarbamoyladenine synthase